MDEVNIFEFLAILKWISPTVGIINTALGWASPIPCYWSEEPPIYYERVLKRHGIRMRAGHTICKDGFIIMVAPEDVNNARKLLYAHGADLA